jgi:hypothetical protein
LLSGVLLLLAFVIFLVVLLPGVVVGVTGASVIVRRIRIVVRGLVFIGLLWFTRVVFASDFSFLFPCINILGLLLHEEKGSGFAITLQDFVLEAVGESFVKLVSKGRVTPVTVGG